MALSLNSLSYEALELNKNNKKNQEIDINSPDYLHKFIDVVLKVGLKNFKKNNKKPFKLSKTRNLTIIQYPPTYDISLYDEWYKQVETVINKVFYRKESDNDEIPDAYQRSRLYTTINSKEYEINGNIVIKSIPIFVPTRTKAKLTTSKENKDIIQGKKTTSNKKKTNCMYVADDSDSDTDYDSD